MNNYGIFLFTLLVTIFYFLILIIYKLHYVAQYYISIMLLISFSFYLECLINVFVTQHEARNNFQLACDTHCWLNHLLVHQPHAVLEGTYCLAPCIQLLL